MTETDATKRPLEMPENFLPYLEKYRLYLLFKDMLEDLVVNLPRDHLKHMKIFLARNLHTSNDIDKVILLISPELNIDVLKLVKELIKDLGVFAITRRYIMDRYEKHDDYEPGCVTPALMAEVTKNLTMKNPVVTGGWLMFDHPCTVREARCLQQDGVLPTVTLVLTPPPPPTPPVENAHTPARSFFQQDFEGLNYAYRATLKEVYVESNYDTVTLATKCFNAVRACAAGLQGPGQGLHVVGAPGVYRVLVIGPRGAGCKTQGRILAKHFGIVYYIYNEAKQRHDDIGGKIRSYGESIQLRADVLRRRLLQKDCIDHGWVLNGYPISGQDFEKLDNMSTPPNRVIFLNADMKTCKNRIMSVAVDWCTGKRVTPGSGPRAVQHPGSYEKEIEDELEVYFTDALAELRAAAGITAVQIECGNDGIDEIQTKLQAAVIASPAFNIEACAQLRGKQVRAD